jgi:hypothetical protein
MTAMERVRYWVPPLQEREHVEKADQEDHLQSRGALVG